VLLGLEAGSEWAVAVDVLVGESSPARVLRRLDNEDETPMIVDEFDVDAPLVLPAVGSPFVSTPAWVTRGE